MASEDLNRADASDWERDYWRNRLPKEIRPLAASTASCTPILEDTHYQFDFYIIKEDLEGVNTYTRAGWTEKGALESI
jgi:hypothetical protein